MKLVIDVDAGIDDALAIMMVLGCDDVEVVAITTVNGNTNLVNVGNNVLRVLDAASRTDIPVYEGCPRTLMGTTSTGYSHHGFDGFGDNPKMAPVDRSLLRKEHAASRLVALSKEFEGELVLLALGPLTNVAVALRLDPDFGRRLKGCTIMGGNSRGLGSMTVSAEFNFYFDPEAAHVALNELGCPLTLVGWEVSLAAAWPWELFKEAVLGGAGRSVQLIRDAEWNFTERVRVPERNVTADAVATAVLLRPAVALETTTLPARVCLSGEARGMLLLDRRSYRALEPWPAVRVVEAVDVAAFRSLMVELVHRLP